MHGKHLSQWQACVWQLHRTGSSIAGAPFTRHPAVALVSVWLAVLSSIGFDPRSVDRR
jgi:hypothetical protein